jgi:hypothetical protein
MAQLSLPAARDPYFVEVDGFEFFEVRVEGEHPLLSLSGQHHGMRVFASEKRGCRKVPPAMKTHSRSGTLALTLRLDHFVPINNASTPIVLPPGFGEVAISCRGTRGGITSLTCFGTLGEAGSARHSDMEIRRNGSRMGFIKNTRRSINGIIPLL